MDIIACDRGSINMCFANVLNELNTILLYYMSLVSHGYFISFHFFLTYVAISGMSREWLLGSGWYILGKKNLIFHNNLFTESILFYIIFKFSFYFYFWGEVKQK